ncbi:hypothetical protein ACLB2K_047693 [Fragaria x ananassa]
MFTTKETEDKVECRLLLDVIICQSAAILQLLAGEDEPLLVRGDALLILDLGLDAEEEFGYHHPMGASTIPCTQDTFLDITSHLSV